MNSKVPEDAKPSGLMNSLLGAAVGGSLIGAWLAPSATARWSILTLVLVMVALVVGFYFWRRRCQSKRSGQFGRGLLGFFDEMRKGRDPSEVARLDALKRKFEVLTRRLKEAGQDVYQIPWFLIIGPSGSGKSWALRGVRQLEPLEGDSEGSAPSRTGKGGTFLMDWWNSPEAMVLDTAGGVVFPEEKALESPEWKALLELLRRSRPECPINGLLVVIPSEMLLLKESELPPGSLTLEAYAQAVRSQIRERLQRKLQLRFPVYFLVTKSDKIPGFREFADEIEATRKPGLKDQILGWSELRDLAVGPVPGQPKREEFEAAAVERHVREIASNVRRHRNTMLVKYAGNACSRGGPDGGMLARRQAATLFSFAGSMDQMAPRLREFAEAVFQPDPLAPLPPFVRGIYFTSAMREGEALDPLRARRLGTSLAKLALPGGPDRNVAKAFFLRDLFLQKIFPEGGLVMPLVAARKYLLSRRRTLVWSGIGAACFLLLTLGIGGVRYLRQIRQPLERWRLVSQEAQNPSKTNWFSVFEGSIPGSVTLHTQNVKRHAELAKHASEYRQRGLLAWLVGSGMERELEIAGRKLFERGVVRPLVGLVEEGLRAVSRAQQRPGVPEAEIKAELDRIEGGLRGWLEFQLCPTNLPGDAELFQSGDRFLDGLVGFLVPNPSPEELAALTSAFRATYGGTANRRRFWPDGDARAAGSEFATVLDAALSRLAQLQREELGRLGGEMEAVKQQAGSLQGLLKAEEDLVGSVSSGEESNAQLEGRRKELERDWQALLQFLTGQKAASITAGFVGLTNQITQSANTRRELLEKELRTVNGSTEQINSQSFIAPLREALDRHLHGEEWTNRLHELTSPDQFDRQQLARNEQLTLAVPAASPATRQQVTQPVLELRLKAYQQIFGDRRRFLLSGNALPPPSMPDRVTEEVSRALTKVPTLLPSPAAFAGLELQEGAAGSRAFADVLTNFLARLWMEQAIENWNLSFSNKLPAAKLPESGPARVLAAVTDAANQLQALEGRVAELKRASELEIRPRPPAPRQLRELTEAIAERREQLRDSLQERLRSDSPPTAIPFRAPPGGKELEEEDVRARYQIVRQWKTAWDRLPPTAQEAVRKLDPDSPEFLTNAISRMAGDFDRIYDLSGSDRGLPEEPMLLRYELSFPGTNVLAGYLASQSEVTASADALGSFREWRLGSQAVLRDPSSSTQSSTPFAADAPFGIQARKDTDGYPWVEVIPRQSWTIIRLIAGGEAKEISRGKEWLVPLRVSDGGKSWTAWLLIKKGASRGGR